jgi:hypothetical protein
MRMLLLLRLAAGPASAQWLDDEGWFLYLAWSSGNTWFIIEIRLAG